MKKIVLYTYLGTNGSITSPVHLEDTYYTRKLRLIADNRFKRLTKDGKQLFEDVIIDDTVDAAADEITEEPTEEPTNELVEVLENLTESVNDLTDAIEESEVQDNEES